MKVSNVEKLKKSIEKLFTFIVDESKFSISKTVENPAAAFNLVWRTNNIWPRKLKTLTAHFKLLQTSLRSHKDILDAFPHAMMTEFPVTDTKEMTAAARGLLTLQHYHNISCQELASGLGDQTQRLNIDQMTEIGQTARHNRFLNLAVDWFQAALDLAQVDSKLKSKLESMLIAAKEAHDGHVIARGLVDFHDDKTIFYTNNVLYDQELQASDIFSRHKSEYESMLQFCSRDVDLSRQNINKDMYWRCIYMGLEDMRRQLCQNQFNDPILKIVKCLCLHYDDPYLRLAPVKFEQVKLEPFVGIIVDIVYPEEMETVMREARNKMITTTLVDYNSANDINEDYTSRRTSKVTYRSEKALPRPLVSWTKRIELATQLGMQMF